MNNWSQQQKILALMSKRQDKDWFFPYDFMDPALGQQYFVGYEASARLSELAKDHPDMMESKRGGKYIKRRIRWEDMELWFGALPKDLRFVFHRYGTTGGLKKSEAVVNKLEQTGNTKTIEVTAVYKGHKGYGRFDAGETYKLTLKHLILGQPVVILFPEEVTYDTITAFRKDWKAL